MNCPVPAWTHPAKTHPDAPCPNCGYSGYGHITKFVGDQIGRHCLECHAAWPIAVEPEPVDPGEPVFGPSPLMAALPEWRREHPGADDPVPCASA